MNAEKTNSKLKFSDIFSKAIETLPPQQLRVYQLHLLGSMNIEIADELHIPASQVSQLLYYARNQVKDFFRKNYGYSPEDVHQEITALQKEDPERISRICFLKRQSTKDAEQREQRIEPLRQVEKIGVVKDICIQARYENKDIFRVAELLEFPFSEGEKRELFEQLEEYDAAQQGLEQLVEDRVDFDALELQLAAKKPIEPPDSAPSRPKGIMLIPIVLIARALRQPAYAPIGIKGAEATARPREPNVWQLVTEDRAENIPLPTEMAQRCYGVPEQNVTILLRRMPALEEGMYEPQLEVSPPPTEDALTFTLKFANDEERTLTVPKPRRRRSSSAWSQRCDPLPAEAFGGKEWGVSVGIRGEMTSVGGGLMDILHALISKGTAFETPSKPLTTLSSSCLSFVYVSTFQPVPAYIDSILNVPSISFGYVKEG